EATPLSIFSRGLTFDGDGASAFERRCAETPWHWTPALSLLRDTTIWFPRDFLLRKDKSRGLAAGNTYAEAILQGLCEVIESHVASRVYDEQLVLPSIDAESIRNPLLRRVLAAFARRGIEVIFKNGSDLGGGPAVVLAYFCDHQIQQAHHPYLRDREPK